MKVDFYAPAGSLGETSRAARRAAGLGFDGYMIPETTHEPFLAAAVAQQSAPGMATGTAIAVAFARSPMITALAAWDLAREGRFLLGLGTQVRTHVTRRFSVPWAPPVARLRDYVGAVRAVWDAWQHGTRLAYRGEFYRLTLMTPFFDPGPIDDPDVPVWIAAVGADMIRLAGEIADGIHIHPFHTARYLDEVVLPGLDAGAARGERATPDCSSSVLVATGADDAEIAASVDQVRRQIAFYASTPAYRPVLQVHGWTFGAQLSSLSVRGRWDEMAALIDDAVIDEVAVVGHIDEIGSMVRRRYEGRMDRIGLYPLVELTDVGWRRVLDGIRGA